MENGFYRLNSLKTDCSKTFPPHPYSGPGGDITHHLGSGKLPLTLLWLSSEAAFGTPSRTNLLFFQRHRVRHRLCLAFVQAFSNAQHVSSVPALQAPFRTGCLS